MLRLILTLPVVLLFSCREKTPAEPKENSPEVITEVRQQQEISQAEQEMLDAGLTDLQTSLPGIFVDLKYSGTDNFLHADVYGELNRAYAQPDVAEKLKKAYALLKSKDSSLTFLIYDAARPLSVQQKMWEMVNIPGSDKTKYVSNPAQHSVHNYGAALDITICDLQGNPLDMGTPFDYFGELAQPQLESIMLSEGKLTEQQIANRKLLRTVMQQAGFRQLPTEWWHYNSCSRTTAKLKYKLIE